MKKNLPLVAFGRDSCNIFEEILKQSPNVVADINILHFNFGVDKAVRKEINISFFHLRKASFMRHNVDDIV